MLDNNSSRGGVRTIDMWLILFVGLRLAGFIDWSWWLVMSPMLISIVVAGISAAVHVAKEKN